MRRWLLPALAGLVVLGGCSTPPPPDQNVASLETTGVSPTATSLEPTAGRPRERLDMTPEELDAMSQTYLDCLADNGSVKGQTDAATAAAAEAACLGKKPLPPWEYDVANPESGDFVHAVVRCLRDKGVRFVEEAPAMPGEDRRAIAYGGEQNDPESISKGLELTPACEKELTNR